MNKIFWIIVAGVLPVAGFSQEKKSYPVPPKMAPQMTEFWTPQPPVVTPADMDALVAPPSDALVLFGANGDASEWRRSDGSPITWHIDGGVMTVEPKTGSIFTKREFGDFQLHIEWRSPTVITGESQGRGNSGVFLQNKYEIQVLDNYENETYVNGMAGSIYKQSPPLVNAAQQPGKWNVYDIIYTAPRFKENGTLHEHGRVTLLWNGVVVQNHTLILGTTEYIGLPKIVPHGRGPIQLQDHKNPVSFRNIWIREL